MSYQISGEMMATLEIRDLHVSVAEPSGASKEILRGVDRKSVV